MRSIKYHHPSPILCQIVKADVFPNWQEVRRENALVEIQTLVYPKCPNPKPYDNKENKR